MTKSPDALFASQPDNIVQVDTKVFHMRNRGLEVELNCDGMKAKTFVSI
mgnify:CR=1 FL=1